MTTNDDSGHRLRLWCQTCGQPAGVVERESGRLVVHTTLRSAVGKRLSRVFAWADPIASHERVVVELAGCTLVTCSRRHRLAVDPVAVERAYRSRARSLILEPVATATRREH